MEVWSALIGFLSLFLLPFVTGPGFAMWMNFELSAFLLELEAMGSHSGKKIQCVLAFNVI